MFQEWFSYNCLLMGSGQNYLNAATRSVLLKLYSTPVLYTRWRGLDNAVDNPELFTLPE